MPPRSLRVLAIGLLTTLCTPVVAAPPPVKNFFPAKNNPKIGQSAPVNPRGQFLLRADEVTYDQEMDVITATGNVEVSQGDRVLLADTVSYNRRAGSVTASGNVTLMEPTGEVLFGDFMELNDELRDGFINNAKALLTDNSRLAAVAGQRTEGSREEFVKGVFSPCDLCKDDPSRPPLWQMKGVRMTRDEVDREITFHDATLEMYGVPVFYSPYFSMPDPTVKRRSGFLNPVAGEATGVGAWLGVPYYGVLSDSADLTVEPRVFTHEGPFLGAEYRQSFDNGKLRLAISGADGYVLKGGQINANEQRIRGNIAGEGRFDLDDNWRTGFDIARATDQTYLRRFHVTDTYRPFGHYDLPNLSTSDVYTEGFFGESYAQASAFAFQSLVIGSVAEQLPKVAPYGGYSYVGPRGENGGYVKVDTNMLSLTRQQLPPLTNGQPRVSTASDRLATVSGYYLPYTSSRGDVWMFSGTLEADGYYVEDVFDPRTGKPYTGSTGRVHPQAAAQWRYPMIKQSGTTSYLIEPIADVVVGPNGDNPSRIPNEDSQAFEFDETNLFSLRRYPGYDLVASGSRVDYGLNTGVYGEGGGSTTAFLGQSATAHPDPTFSPTSGLHRNISDIVGKVAVSPRKFIDLSYRFRLDRASLKSNRDEFAVTTYMGKSNVTLSYLNFAGPVNGVSTSRTSQGGLSTFLAINDYWTAYGAYTRDLVANQSRVGRIGAYYRDECYAILISLDETFQTNQDLQKGFSLLVRFSLKYLGDFGG